MDCSLGKYSLPTDATLVPPCPRPQLDPYDPRSRNCGCPDEEKICEWECILPGELETRFYKQPKICVKPECHYTIPAIPCYEETEVREPPCNPLCFDWTVNEPGPNDSYGLNGLNWYDWEMEDITRYSRQQPTRGYVPAHPGYSKIQAPASTPTYMCRLPIECYARSPGPVKCDKFPKAVNYFRDWRCRKAMPPGPWKPPYAQWATNQHL